MNGSFVEFESSAAKDSIGVTAAHAHAEHDLEFTDPAFERNCKAVVESSRGGNIS
jgi:hypothetical protein